MYGFLAALACWFNACGFFISCDNIFHLLEMLSLGMSVCDWSEFVALLQICFAKNKVQVEAVEGILLAFIEREDVQNEIENLKKLQEDAGNASPFQKQYEEKIKSLDAQEKEQMEKIHVEFPLDREISEEDYRKLQDLIRQTGLKGLCQSSRNLLEDISHHPHTLARLLEQPESLHQELTARMEQAIWDMNFDIFDAFNNLVDTLQAILERTRNTRAAKAHRVQEICDHYARKRKNEKAEFNRLEREYRQTKEKVEQKLHEILGRSSGILIQKDRAVTSRKQFLSGSNGIWCEDEGRIMDLNKKLSALNPEETRAIYEAVRHSSLALKTRLMKSMYSGKAKTLDLNATIQSACKTGGLPLQLIPEKERGRKAKIVLVLDISGSCSSASRMMLHTMHCLQEVFPAGCKAYVFVNTLHDISALMKASDPVEAVNAVFGAIPTRGVYSDYNVPLTDMWNKCRTKSPPRRH